MLCVVFFNNVSKIHCLKMTKTVDGTENGEVIWFAINSSHQWISSAEFRHLGRRTNHRGTSTLTTIWAVQSFSRYDGKWINCYFNNDAFSWKTYSFFSSFKRNLKNWMAFRTLMSQVRGKVHRKYFFPLHSLYISCLTHCNNEKIVKAKFTEKALSLMNHL